MERPPPTYLHTLESSPGTQIELYTTITAVYNVMVIHICTEKIHHYIHCQITGNNNCPCIDAHILKRIIQSLDQQILIEYFIYSYLKSVKQIFALKRIRIHKGPETANVWRREILLYLKEHLNISMLNIK